MEPIKSYDSNLLFYVLTFDVIIATDPTRLIIQIQQDLKFRDLKYIQKQNLKIWIKSPISLLEKAHLFLSTTGGRSQIPLPKFHLQPQEFVLHLLLD